MRSLHENSRRRGRLAAVALLLSAGLALFAGHARAGDVETRTFNILVDGKAVGTYKLIVQSGPDATFAVAAESNVRVTFLAVPVYTYSYSGREIWKGGRLQHFSSTGKEKGKDFAVKADLDGATLRVQCNGEVRCARVDVWTTSCWKLPDAAFRNGEVRLLACDSGKELVGRMEYVGNEQVKVAGQMQNCSHFRVTKDVVHDVWYDAQERLVRDEWTSNGHHTVMEVTEVRR